MLQWTDRLARFRSCAVTSDSLPRNTPSSLPRGIVRAAASPQGRHAGRLVTLIAPLDVFIVDVDGERRWIAAAGSLAHATDLIRSKGPGTYVIYSPKTRHKDVIVVTAQGTTAFIKRLDD